MKLYFFLNYTFSFETIRENKITDKIKLVVFLTFKNKDSLLAKI